MTNLDHIVSVCIPIGGGGCRVELKVAIGRWASWRGVFHDPKYEFVANESLREVDEVLGFCQFCANCSSGGFFLSVHGGEIETDDTARVVHFFFSVAETARLKMVATPIEFLRFPHTRVSLRLLEALRDGPKTLDELRSALSRNVPAAEIHGSLARMERRGMARMERQKTGGRPRDVWSLCMEHAQ